jgi:hypothetical protein
MIVRFVAVADVMDMGQVHRERAGSFLTLQGVAEP